MNRCARCNTPFDTKKSTSTLRNTYCGWMCERSEFGFVIAEFVKSDIKRVHRTGAAEDKEIVAV